MEWKQEIKDIFDKFIERVPDTFRSMVESMLFETTQKKCLERNASHVNEADLITALLDITPEPFKAEAVVNLRELGVDVDRYIKLKEIRDQHRRSWDEILQAFHPGNYHFTMYLTDRCNQNCLHCAANLRQHRPELSTEQWISIIENLESNLKRQGRRGVYIWFGGEPTIRSDIRELIKYCGDKDYYQAIATNGILFDEEFAKFCADNKMSHVFVSLDSVNPEKADRIRGANKSFAHAEKAIKNALKYGLFVLVTATVMKQNLDELNEIKELIESWGAMPYFRAVIKQRSAAQNWDEIGLTVEDYKKFYDFKYNLTLEAIRNGKAGTIPTFSTYDMVPFMEQPVNDKELTYLEWGVGCQACRTISGVDVNGDLFPCDYPSSLTLGNVLNSGFGDIMNSQVFKDIRDRKRVGKCATCHHIDLCGGGCRVHAECETGNFFESFSYCWHENDHVHVRKENE
ncbi:MAG TPA: radical SAM protein [Pseudobacteroides sp.]|nr:radical SAM protein [Pseudobacteroides sp.]